MPEWGYSITHLDPERTVKASGRELRISHKAAREICNTIKGMRLEQAKRYLRLVIAKKQPVPFKRFRKKVGHKGQLQKADAGKYPVKAVGFGSRQRRVTGDQFDNFSVDFVYEDGMHLHSMCRQINGCANNVSEWVVGTKGVSNCRDMIKDHSGNVVWEYPYEKNDAGDPIKRETVSPYVQEHIDLITAIRTEKPFNEAENTAKSNLIAIMGRISAYTGKEVTWDEMMSSDLEYGPKELKWGSVDIDKSIPVPGTEKR